MSDRHILAYSLLIALVLDFLLIGAFLLKSNIQLSALLKSLT